jgi:hypothetical protein
VLPSSQTCTPTPCFQAKCSIDTRDPPRQALLSKPSTGSTEVRITSGTVTSTLTVVVDRPTGLGGDTTSLVADSVDAAHYTGVPPQFIRAHAAQESGGDRMAYRYEPIGPTYGDLFFASRRQGGSLPKRVVAPYSLIRLAFVTDAIDAAMPEGVQLLNADRDPRASLRIGCDPTGAGGNPSSPW